MANFGQTLMNSLDKSLFDKSSYSKAVRKDDGPYRIEIIPVDFSRHDLSIIGVIQEPISISMDPEWDVLNLASIVSNFPKIESLFNMAVAPMAAAGVSLTNAGLCTEKYFVKGSYIKIDANFKVVNWDDDGQPLKAATLLLNLCTPKKMKAYNVEEIIAQFLDLMEKIKADVALKKVADLLEGSYNFITTAFLGGVTFDEMIKSVKTKMDTKMFKDIKTAYNRGLKEVKTGEFMLTNSPPCIEIKIGNYFDHPEMIIENVAVDFSKQMTKSGPLYANFKVSLSSKTMPLMMGDGIYSTGLKLNSQRVQIQGKELNTTGVR